MATNKQAYAKGAQESKVRIYTNKQVDFIPEGEAYPSVTTILSVISKPMLYVWYQQQGTTKALILKEEFKIALGPFWPQVEEWVEMKLPGSFWKCGQDLSDEAKSRGTMAHDAIDHWTKTGEWAYDKDVENAISAFKQFVAEHEMKVLESEIALASNTFKYAGRTDIIAELDGKLALLDIKTSSGFYPEMGLQLSAYKQAYKEMTGKIIEELWIIRVDNREGKLETKQYEDDLSTFLGALALWKGLRPKKKV